MPAKQMRAVHACHGKFHHEHLARQLDGRMTPEFLLQGSAQ
jgi:hypothetical protein